MSKLQVLCYWVFHISSVIVLTRTDQFCRSTVHLVDLGGGCEINRLSGKKYSTMTSFKLPPGWKLGGHSVIMVYIFRVHLQSGVIGQKQIFHTFHRSPVRLAPLTQPHDSHLLRAYFYTFALNSFQRETPLTQMEVYCLPKLVSLIFSGRMMFTECSCSSWPAPPASLSRCSLCCRTSWLYLALASHVSQRPKNTMPVVPRMTRQVSRASMLKQMSWPWVTRTPWEWTVSFSVIFSRSLSGGLRSLWKVCAGRE